MVDAVQLGLAEYADDPWQAWRCDRRPDWLSSAATEILYNAPRLAPVFSSEDYWYFDVVTINGSVRMGPDEWLIRGVEGELYPCADAIFRATYEQIDGEDVPCTQPAHAWRPDKWDEELEVCAHCGLERPA